jgi:hypothetical protein
MGRINFENARVCENGGFVTDPTRDIAEPNDRNVWKLFIGSSSSLRPSQIAGTARAIT